MPSMPPAQLGFRSEAPEQEPSSVVVTDTGHGPAVALWQKAAAKLQNFEPDEATINKWQTTSKGAELTGSKSWLEGLGVPAPTVYLHQDHLSHLLTLSQNAEALTVGNHIYLSAHTHTPGLLAHELAHVAQSVLPGPVASQVALEKEANDVARLSLAGKSVTVQLSGAPSMPMRHPAARVLLRAGSWLLRRTTNALTRHIARHGHRIAGRAIHSVFRNPRAIRDLVSVAIREATTIARNATSHGATTVLEQGGVRIFRQAGRVPGKFRIIVEKNFGRAIGTRGETILRLVLDMSGRVVTAFPVDRFLAVGLGVGAIEIFGERSAEASERIRSRIEAEENRPTDWVGEILDFLNPLSGGSLNEGEDTILAIDRIVADTTASIIREIEESEQRSLSQEQRNAIGELVRAGLGGTLNLENPEE